MTNALRHAERLSRVAVSGENDVLMFLVMNHVLPSSINNRENMRFFIARRLMHVSFVMLSKQ